MAEGQWKYRKAFLERHGDEGPWPCVFCEEDVVMEELNIHHLDEDHANNDAENLSACHRSCHTTHHHKGRRKNLRKDNQTGFKEVKQDTRRRYPSFHARYCCLLCNKRLYVPGRFPTPEAAAANRELFEREHMLKDHEIALEGKT